MNPTLNPTMWDRRAYIAATVQYIEAYLGAAKARLIADEQLEPTLRVFQKLIASKATDHHGLHLLSCIFECIDLNTLGPYVQTIVSALMMRMSRAKTSKYVYVTLVALSTFVLRFGSEVLRNALDNFQKDLLDMFIKQVWLPDVVKIRDVSQRRICALGLTELCCGSGDICVHEPYRSLWAEMINANIALVEGIIVDDQGTAERERDALAKEAEEVGVLVGTAGTYASSQSLLRWGIGMNRNINVVDSITNGQDTRAVVFVKVSAFIERHKNKAAFEQMLNQAVDPEAREDLSTYESVAKRGIVA